MFSLRVMGTLALDGPGTTSAVNVLAHAKRAGLLAYLALARPRGFHRRDTIYALFWPESDAEHARNSLRQALHQIRRALGPELIANRGDDEVGLVTTELTCDAVEFERAVEEGRHADAYALYGGDLLTGFFVSDAPAFEEWLENERARLRGLALKAAWATADDLARGGDPAGAAAAARRAAAWQSLDEIAQRRLIELLDRLGDTGGALRVFDEFAERLREELEAEPSEATVAVIRRIRERSSTLPPPPTWALPPAVGGPAATTPSPGRRRFALPALVLVVALVGAALVWRRSGHAAVMPASRTVAVFPFAVRGGAEIAYLGDGMVDMLSANLEGVSGLHAIDPHSVIAALPGDSGASPAARSAIALRLGAGRFITGEIVEVAGRLQIRGSLYRSEDSERPAIVASVTGDTTALFGLVDDLAGRLLVGFGAGRDTTLTRLASVTTHSLPALKAFLAGEQAMRAGRDAEAAAAFREAATLDTSFALAQYRLAVSATWVAVSGATDNRTIALMAAAAARHAEHLTPLVRDLLSAYTAYKSVRADEAERAYRRLTESHPENVEAWFMLGETWFHYNPWRGRSPQEARQAFARVLALDPTNTHAVVHLARLAAADGRDGDLDSLGRVYLARYRDAQRTLEMRTLLASLHANPAERSTIAREATATDAIVMVSLIQSALVYAENLDLSRALVPAYLRVSRDTAFSQVGRRILSDLELSAGRWSRQPALDLLGAALDDDWLFETRALLAACRAVPVSQAQLVALRDTVAARRSYPGLGRPSFLPLAGLGEMMQAYLVGLLSARLGDTAQTRARLNALMAMHSGRTEIALGLAHTLRAELAQAAGEPGLALVELQRFSVARIEVGHWGMHERFLMAELLRQLGRNEEALEWYASFPAGFDEPWVAPAHLRAAQIYERLGNAERARFHYRRFLGLWSGADAEFQPMVTQAREALARLSS